jgi:glycosyltransferase involved in cell wall biosynthesis
LVPHKQIEHAFEVVARLAPEHPDLHLDVVGEGWWHDELVTAASVAGVSDRVTFHGHVTEQQRDDLLARAWVMVMPSVKEGWCLAVTEAGAQGTPSVAYATAGGVTESIEDRVTGLLADDLDAMVDAVRTLLVDRGLRARLGENARDKAATLTWAACADAAEKVLASASNGTRPGDQSP